MQPMLPNVDWEALDKINAEKKKVTDHKKYFTTIGLLFKWKNTY